MTTLNGYTFDEEHPIGEGGMGCVFRARSPEGHTVALKMLHSQFASEQSFRTFFEVETKVLSTLSHPSVVRIMGTPFTDSYGNLYLPMEFIEGCTIESRVKSLKQKGLMMSMDEILDIMEQTLDAFSYIHSRKIIHRDVKPSNIMIRNNGSICVIDFGIAKDEKLPTGYTIGHTLGTNGYMSPEQVNGLNIDHRTDIYSLGCLLYYMLTGEHAIAKRSNDFETRVAILHDDFPKASELRPDIGYLEEVIDRCTNKNMLRRYKDANEMKRALAQGGPESDSVTVTVGRNKSNDIEMPSIYVSGFHLEITYTVDSASSYLTITDHSTNGTALDGRFLKNNSESINFDIFSSPISNLPEILLAAREECPLDWNQVIDILKRQAKRPADTPPPLPPDGSSGIKTKQKSTDSNLGLIFFIIAIALAIACLVSINM